MNNKVLIIIQARSGSTRLPDKIFLSLSGKPLLIRMFERVNSSKVKNDIVVATTKDSSDDKVAELCKINDINCFRGDTNDLLDRHYKAAIQYNADVVVKIPSDCPLIDSKIIDKVISYYLENTDKFDFVSNLHPATYPDGNDVEVMSFDVLKTAWQNAQLQMEREHTTPYIWEHPEKFRIGNVVWEKGFDYSMSYRFTIDYYEDYLFIKKVYDELFEQNNFFGLDDILELLNEKPEIKKINEKYAGVNWYGKHLNELKTINKNQTKILNG